MVKAEELKVGQKVRLDSFRSIFHGAVGVVVETEDEDVLVQFPEPELPAYEDQPSNPHWCIDERLSIESEDELVVGQNVRYYADYTTVLNGKVGVITGINGDEATVEFTFRDSTRQEVCNISRLAISEE